MIWLPPADTLSTPRGHGPPVGQLLLLFLDPLDLFVTFDLSN